MKGKRIPDPRYRPEEEAGLPQKTEWTYHSELGGAKFRTRFERESELGEHRFVVQEYNHKTDEWNLVWTSSWIGKRVT